MEKSQSLDTTSNKKAGIITRKSPLYFWEYIIVILIFVTELAIFFGFVEQELPILKALAIHFVIVMISIGWCVIRNRKQLDLSFCILLTVLTMAAGCFGTMITIISILGCVVTPKNSKSFLDWLTSMFPDEHKIESQELYQRIADGWDDLSDKNRLVAFQDIMSFGSIEQKREVLEKISRFYRREFSPILQSALNDKNNAIRVQAATVIAKLTELYTSKYNELYKQFQKGDDSPALILKIAKNLDEYVYSGIVGKENEREIREKAIRFYEEYLKKEPEDLDVVFVLGRLYLHNKQGQQAYEKIKICINNDQYFSSNLVLWYMEVLYDLKNYDELLEIAKKYYQRLNKEEVSITVTNMLQLWNQGVELAFSKSEPKGEND